MNRNDVAEIMDALEMTISFIEIQEQHYPSPEARLLINHAKNTLIRAKKKFASAKHSR